MYEIWTKSLFGGKIYVCSKFSASAHLTTCVCMHTRAQLRGNIGEEKLNVTGFVKPDRPLI